MLVLAVVALASLVQTKDYMDLAEQLANGVANNIEWHNNANKERRKWDGAESANQGANTPPYSLALRKMLLQHTANDNKAMQVNSERAIRDRLGGVVQPTHFASQWVRQRSEAQIRRDEGTRTGLIPVRPTLSTYGTPKESQERELPLGLASLGKERRI